MAQQTLDQQRAAFAWSSVNRAGNELGARFRDYRNLAKGAPALIMGSGLMAAIAFYQSRGKTKEKEAEQLVGDVLGWLQTRGLPGDFRPTMVALQSAGSLEYMQLTEEALAFLRWVRQFSDAVLKDDPRKAGG
jgi:CRISPR-associated protein Cmr5